MYNLTGIYWIKNETPYLPEWIEFHLMQGFDHFIFYDNNSDDGLVEVMAPYLEENLVEIRYYPSPLNPPARSGPPGSKNFWVMDYCIEEQRGKSKWIHFHAVDEFTFMVDGSSVVDHLSNYETYGALSIEWELFNSNGHMTRPDGLVIENYTKAYPDENHHVKTIIRPELALCTIGNPHNFILNNGLSAVTSNFMFCPTAWNTSDMAYKPIKNHHYVTRSKQEFDEKNGKGLLDFDHTENIKRSKAFEDQWNIGENNPDVYECTDLLRYVDPVRQAIAKRYLGREYLLNGINH